MRKLIFSLLIIAFVIVVLILIADPLLDLYERIIQALQEVGKR